MRTKENIEFNQHCRDADDQDEFIPTAGVLTKVGSGRRSGRCRFFYNGCVNRL